MSQGSWCSAPNCKNSKKKRPDLSFFRFPRDEERCKVWVRNSGRQDLFNKDINYVYKTFMLCSDHFEVDQCMNPKKNKLIWNAIPTLFELPKKLPTPGRPKGRRKLRTVSRFKSRTGCREGCEDYEECKRCLYMYCRNNSRKQNMKFMEGIYFLPVPSAELDQTKRKLWLKSCGRHDLSRDRSTDGCTFYVCSVHFEGGNGPTTEHPDPIPHVLTQRINPMDGKSKIRLVTSNYMPVPISRMEPEESDVTSLASFLAPNTTCTNQNMNLVVSGQMNQLYSSIRSITEQRSHGDSHYEITVRELPSFSSERYSLNDIRAGYPIPLYWTMCLTINSIFFTKISEVTHCLLVKFTIYGDMTADLQALCRNLDPSHPLLQTFPKAVTDSKVLDQCFSLLQSWSPCRGNGERAYVSLFTQSQNISGFYSPQTGSVHSLNCTLLMNKKSARCKSCQQQRVSLRSILRRFIKTHGEFLDADENDENVETPEDNYCSERQ